jgi:hypothetical protein
MPLIEPPPPSLLEQRGRRDKRQHLRLYLVYCYTWPDSVSCSSPTTDEHEALGAGKPPDSAPEI